MRNLHEITDIYKHIPGLKHIDTFQMNPATYRGDRGDEGEEPAKTTPLFRLDWRRVDEYKINEYSDWINKYWRDKYPPDLQGKSPATLPIALDELVCDLEFAVPKSYAAEIDHFTDLYVSEARRKREMDTVIRDMCGQVRVKAMNSALKLLADCAIDRKTGGWLRSMTVNLQASDQGCWPVTIDKHILQSLLMYKFWYGVTGRGLVWEFAEFDKLKNWSTTAKFSNKHPLAGKARTIDMVLDVIQDFEMKQERFWSFAAELQNDQIIMDAVKEAETQRDSQSGAGSDDS